MSDPIPFPRRAEPKQLTIRRVSLPDLPIEVSSNLQNDEIQEVVATLRDERYFVGLPTESIEGSRIRLRPRIEEVQYRDGHVLVLMLFGLLYLIYRTDEDWALWDQRQRERSEVEQRARQRRELLCRQYDLVRDAALATRDAEHDGEAERLYLQCRAMERTIPELAGYGDAKIRLLFLYSDQDDPQRGISYVEAEGASVQDFEILANGFEHQRPSAAEAVYHRALNHHPYQPSLHKRLALLLARVSRVQEAIEVCEHAACLGLMDDTKSGFSGRAGRLRKRLACT